MIRQFSRKVEKQEILSLKNKKGDTASLPLARNSDMADLRGRSYKPGLLERSFDSAGTNSSGTTQIPQNFDGKMDNTPYYSILGAANKAKEKFNSKTNSGGAQFLRGKSWSNLHKLSGNRFSKPDLIFAIGISELDQPLREASNAGIPIIAVVDSNQNPFIKDRIIDYIIPGNDDSIRSYAFFCMMISQAINEGKIESENN